MANHICRGGLLIVLIGNAVCLAFDQQVRTRQRPSGTEFTHRLRPTVAERHTEQRAADAIEPISRAATCLRSRAAFSSATGSRTTSTRCSSNWGRCLPRGETPPESTHLDILAFLLESNGFPAGQRDLSTTDLATIRLTDKEGAGAVPNYATVETVVCLERTDSGWILNRASEPRRNRNPDKPTEEELKRLTGRALGTHTFILLSPSSFAPGFHIEDHRGEKIAGKGLLIRTDSDERINVTWLESLSKSCP